MKHLEILSSYREQTLVLLDVLESAEEGLLDLDRMEACLQERDRLIQAYDQLENLPSEEVLTLIGEIEQLERAVRGGLSRASRTTQEKITGYQNNQRITNAYHSDYATQPAFIDRKK